MKNKIQHVIVLCLFNLAVVLVAGCILFLIVALGDAAHRKQPPVRESAGKAQDGDTKEKIKLNADVFSDSKKFNSAVESLKEKYQKLKVADPHLYLRNPEYAFFKSMFSYFFKGGIGGAEVVMDEATVKEFRKQGYILYTMDRKYPLMKQSIYIDKKNRSFNKPSVKPGTNVIIIFVESLSNLFLREDIHGVRGMTPNIKDMQNNSFSFTNMTNIAFPTIKGIIASLGSSIYLLDENIGGTRIPIPCRFLFLSNILKELNYYNIHMQAGSERFIGMKDFFIEREAYDAFIGAESLTLDNLTELKGGFGVDDETLFTYMVNWLKKYPGDKPFLITVSTINSHPPFKAKYKFPGGGDSVLLNSFYSTDRALGSFWEYFKTSKYRDNTIVILLADHAMGNNKEYNEFALKFREYYKPFFDVIPCFIHFPGGSPWNGRTNNTVCTNLDLLPTVLDMMNLDLANPFIGLSIFSERPQFSRPPVGQSGAVDTINAEAVARTKMILNLYHYLYKKDRIIPEDFKVKFN